MGAVLAGGAAFAAIPGPDGVIHGCYQKNVGNLRVIDPTARGTCNPSEIAISWSQTGPAGAQGPKGDKGDTGATGPQGPAGPQGTPGTSVAGQKCANGQSITGFDPSGKIICSAGCPSGQLTFHITSSPSATLENWPGGTYTQNSGPNCSVTVRAPSGNISLIGGTAGADAWTIVSKTGWVSASGSVQLPICRSVGALASVSNNRPTCSNSSTVFESGHSENNFVVTVT